jgi:[acyl-carrier-protein] S-malonyltransferase/trans-AT polyketide synthase/acyltransferase/oxidoreductase domain-containing protein
MPVRSRLPSSTTTVVFPGQGSQRAGMGHDFCQRLAASRRVFEEASDALGLDVGALCFEEDPRLSLTEYAQPAILTTEIAMLRGLVEAFGLEARRFGGHSLGEYTGLVAAGAVPLARAVRIVRERGRLMQEAVPVGQGRMLAVIGRELDVSAVEGAIAGLAVTVANDNSPEQVVLSGLAADVATAEARLAADASLRLVALDVSAPFHSPLMTGIEPSFAAVLDAQASGWDPSRAPAVTSNLTGGFHEADWPWLRDRLVHQISGRVRWRSNMAALAEAAGRIIEIGPGRPLRAFFKAVGVTIESITDVRSATRVLGAEAAA